MSTFKTIRNDTKARAEASKNRKEEEHNREVNVARRNTTLVKRFMDFYNSRVGTQLSERYPELYTRYVRSGMKDPQYAELDRKYKIAQMMFDRISDLEVSEMNSVMEGILRRFDETKFHVTDNEVLDFFERMSHVHARDYAKYANRLPISYEQSIRENPSVKQEYERLLVLERENREEQRRLDEKHKREKELMEAERKSLEMQRKKFLDSYQKETEERKQTMSMAAVRATSPRQTAPRQQSRAGTPTRQNQSPNRRAATPPRQEQTRAATPVKQRVSESFFSQDRKAKQTSLSKK